MKDSYKHTKVGLIPSNWKVKTIQDMDFDVSDGNYASKYPKSSDFVESGIPFIRASNLKDGRVIRDDMHFISKKKHAELLKGHLKEQDILISTRGKIGHIALVGNEFVDCNINAQLVRINTQEKVETRFLFYIFSSDACQRQFQRFKTGTALMQLPVNNLIKVIFPLPPFPEQRKIAAILSTLDYVIGKTNAIIEETKQLKKGLMQKLFTEGIGHKRFKETKIGRIPEDWSVLPAELICEKVTDGTHDTPKPVIQGYPLVTSKNLKDGKLNFNDCYNISEEDFIEVNKRSKVDQYDVLFGMIGTIGSPVIILDKDVSYAVKNVGIFKTDKDIELGRWLVHFFNSPLSQKFIERQKNGTSQSFVPLGLLRKFPIPMPSNDERLEINRIFSEVDNKIEKEEATKEQLEQLKKGLMQVLLTGKVKVKV